MEDSKAMLQQISFKNFKNFENASLQLGPFTLLIGANASGKSNIRDAFRFLHGIARGYTLAEIMGEKYIEGGVLQWRGIRGGIKEAAYMGEPSFSLSVGFEVLGDDRFFPAKTVYSIEVRPVTGNGGPLVVNESLYEENQMVFDTNTDSGDSLGNEPGLVRVRVRAGGKFKKGQIESCSAHQPVLTQLAKRIEGKRKDKAARESVHAINGTVAALNAFRFLDLDPDAMRMPSFPGQTILGDRGENLSSVLQAICEDTARKKALVEWIRELTPMDASDFQFIADQTGKILLNLVEENGHVVSAYSASDGTLRFLAMIAALLGPRADRLYFFEELDNGLHPARLHLLLQLVERKAMEGKVQMIGTTHSPQLLRALGKNSVAHASLVYRHPESHRAGIRRIVNMDGIMEILEKQDLARLHESGWFEDAVYFSDENEDSP